MKIYYFSQYDLLRPTTNRISDIRFCEGFAENGCEAEIVVPYVYRSYNIKKREISASYGIQQAIKITTLPTPFWMSAPKWITVPILSFMVLIVYLRILCENRRTASEVTIVSRDVNILVMILLLRKVRLTINGLRIIHWAHEVKQGKRQYRWTYHHVDGIIATNSAIIEDMSRNLGIHKDRFAVTLNAISSWQLNGKTKKDEVRKRLGLDAERPLIVYTGKVGPGIKEIEYILLAASQLPEYSFLLTGGKPKAVEFFQRYCNQHGIGNVYFTGFLNNYTEILKYQIAADVLVSYYTRKDHLVTYNYPQKITEYMLTQNPIVTPDYPATSDVLNSANAIFVEPEDPVSLAAGIRQAIEDKSCAQRKARQAYRDVHDMTFKKRTRLLMDFFRSV